MSPAHPSDPVRDAAVIGAGPSGLAVAATLVTAGVDVVQLDEGPLAATIDRFPPGARLYSPRRDLQIDGVAFGPDPAASPTREAYLQYLAEVAATLDHDLRRRTRVDAVEPGATVHTLRLRGAGSAAGVLRARNVLVASGGHYLPVLLDIPGEQLPHVSHWFRGAEGATGQRIVVAGGRNSAVEAAIELARAGARVALVYRKARLPLGHLKPWLPPLLAAARRDGAVTVHYRAVPAAIDHDGVELLFAGGGRRRLAADRVLLLTGYGPDHTLLEAAGVRRHRRSGRPLFDPRTLELRLAPRSGPPAGPDPARPGLFLCGTAVLRWRGARATIASCRDHGEVILPRLR